MKTLPSRGDIVKALDAHNADSIRPKKLRLRAEALPAVKAFYCIFMKQLVAETDKLMFMEGNMRMKPKHIVAAARKVLPKFSYSHVVREKLSQRKQYLEEQSKEKSEETHISDDEGSIYSDEV